MKKSLKKRGRNDLCWCGSGKKYKRCHLDREREKPLSKGDIFDFWDKNKGSRLCSVHSNLKSECSKKIINAHTISKSGSLKKIADNGHVMGTKVSLPSLIEGQGVIEDLIEVGINQASAFTGFCSYHDKKIFSRIEDFPIDLSSEQLFLLAYRTVARELYAKGVQNKTGAILEEIDRGRSLIEQHLAQGIVREYEVGLGLGLQEITYVKEKMDEIFYESSFTEMAHFWIEMSSLPLVLVSGATQPDFDFHGKEIQDLGDSHKASQHIIFNCIASESKGFFVFSWLKEHDSVCRKFVSSLESLGKDGVANALVRFCYSVCENTWASPKWWAQADDNVKDDVRERLMHNLPLIEMKPDYLVCKGLNYGAYRVLAMGWI